jgi:phage baseplate assembly protein W
MTDYSDINFNFSRNSFTSDINLSTDSSAIKQSIKNILLSFSGEKSFKPNFGGELKKYTFESSSVANTTLALDITELLNTYEPRINVKTVNPEYKNGYLELKVNYTYRFGNDIVNENAVISLD